MAQDVYEKVFAVAKRRGFLYPAFEIYGGAAGMYDYGPLGAALKANMEQVFRDLYVTRDGCVEISCPAVTPEEVFIASGHVEEFTDPMVKCTECDAPFRADHLIEEKGHEGGVPVNDMEAVDALLKQYACQCLVCGGALGEPYRQNLMFGTEIGPGSRKKGFLRPETAQGIFMDFPLLYRHFREKLPFGVIQLGRGYRNEISPRQGMIRLREFNMMECEVFVDPEDGKSHPDFADVADRELTFVPNSTEEPMAMTLGKAVEIGMVCNEALGYYIGMTHEYLTTVGLKQEHLRFRQHRVDEMAHYAQDCWDAEFYSDRFGWIECVGLADRSAYDLSEHEKHSKQPMRALRRFDEPKEVTRTVVMPVGKVIGPLFKAQARAVNEALAALEPKAVKAGEPITLTIDGEDVEVPADAYEVKTTTTKETGEEFVPHVIEPSYGLDRILYAVLEHNYVEERSIDEESGKEETYRKMTLPARTAPIKVGVFPLISKDQLPVVAQQIDKTLRRSGITTYYDDGGSVGRRYARQDEIGTPFCVTVDFDTIGEGDNADWKDTVTVRERDSKEQIRLTIDDLVGWVKARV